MQIIISLLNIQASLSENEKERAVFEESKDRIRSMALIHERLYLEKDILNISLKEYAEELVRELFSSYRGEFPADYIIDIEPVQVSIDQAIPLGLMFNELVTNTLKHAFKDRSGLLTILVTIDGDQLIVTLKDNGPGFDFLHYEGKTFGLELIDILVSQLEGNLTYSNVNGSDFTLRFRYKQS